MISTNITYENAAQSQFAEVLEEIHSTEKNIAIYQRSIDFLKHSLSLAVNQLIEFRTNGGVQEITSSLKHYFESNSGLDEVLLEDILHLLDLFAALTRISSFRVSLAKIDNTMCPRFHADNNQLRMLCTYSGPGTLWLPDEVADRKAYRKGKANDNILRNEGLVQQVDTGDVVVLKGAMYPGKTPILHRSPSLEENKEGRILLTLDTNEPLRFPI